MIYNVDEMYWSFSYIRKEQNKKLHCTERHIAYIAQVARNQFMTYNAS